MESDTPSCNLSSMAVAPINSKSSSKIQPTCSINLALLTRDVFALACNDFLDSARTPSISISSRLALYTNSSILATEPLMEGLGIPAIWKDILCWLISIDFFCLRTNSASCAFLDLVWSFKFFWMELMRSFDFILSKITLSAPLQIIQILPSGNLTNIDILFLADENSTTFKISYTSSTGSSSNPFGYNLMVNSLWFLPNTT
ncbi:hypothetical protein WICPIJ_009380 [Wickerhamomyces pijperi]|uniref:Uncharacterized protein n=1 Tax=Wickerhamomyces pijperi TaxID=599730 RepID=A0A9P8PP72_WICPI|nr:hypothetical protein WICPIJ_009380 [Wickerhamomyces pijperi]